MNLRWIGAGVLLSLHQEADEYRKHDEGADVHRLRIDADDGTEFAGVRILSVVLRPQSRLSQSQVRLRKHAANTAPSGALISPH